ncbi:MAG: phosphopyruvate hydratase [Cyclobacteriaceae bacterium]|nr:phosphopyruvate hydratase [Cyclobacteriaceae bacterium]
MSNAIQSVSALEILDSRGQPTIQAWCLLNDGTMATASVPSGASTGAAEAMELRDLEDNRYHGKGCRRAVENVNTLINDYLSDKEFLSQQDLDQALMELDGTTNKSKLGANAILGVSLAYCRAQARTKKLPLYQHLSAIAEIEPKLPRPMINLFSGGKHGGQQTSIQDVQLVMLKAGTIGETMEMMHTVYYTAVQRMASHYQMRLLTADEGGLAPSFSSSEEMIQEAVNCIRQAGFTPGKDIALTLDVAASHFYQDGLYLMDGTYLSSEQLVELLVDWSQQFPIISIEDGLAENDWQGWTQFMNKVPEGTLVLGDDLLCTNPVRIEKAISEKAANSLLLKVNQIGTLTEALQAYSLARDAGWKIVVSARSGETEDHWLSDLATGWAGDFIKVGSITQSERLAKYNRLLAIESDNLGSTNIKLTSGEHF